MASKQKILSRYFSKIHCSRNVARQRCLSRATAFFVHSVVLWLGEFLSRKRPHVTSPPDASAANMPESTATRATTFSHQCSICRKAFKSRTHVQRHELSRASTLSCCSTSKPTPSRHQKHTTSMQLLFSSVCKEVSLSVVCQHIRIKVCRNRRAPMS
jgi:hypothetical protein